MTAAQCLRLSSSLVTRWLRARRLPFRRAKDTNKMRKIYQPPLFNDKNAFRKSVNIYKKLFSSRLSTVRTGTFMDATLLDVITWLINLDLIPFTNKSKTSKYIQLLWSFSVPGKCVSDFPPSMCFSSNTGKNGLERLKISPNNKFFKIERRIALCY